MINLRYGRMILKNFGSYRGEHVFDWDRGPQFWYISGQNLSEPALGANGAGKSTLITALYWALFGRTLRNTRPGDRVEPWHGVDKAATSVELEFLRGNEKYQIYRSRKPNRLTLNGEVVTDDKLQTLLPDPEVMLYTHIFGQFNALFLDLKPEAQSQLFTDLLELDVWLNAAERAGKAATSAEARITAHEREIASFEGRIAEAQNNLAYYRQQETTWSNAQVSKLKELGTTLASLAAQAKDKQRELSNLPEPPDFSELIAQRDDCARVVQQWRKIVSDTSVELRLLNSEITKLQTETKAVDAGTCPTCGQSLTQHNANELAKHQEIELADLTSRQTELTVKRDDAEIEAQGWQEDVTKLDAKLFALRDQEREIASARRVLEQEIAVLNSQLRDTERQWDKLDKESNPHTSEVTKLGIRIDTYQAALKQEEAGKLSAGSEKDMAELWREGFRTIRLSIIDETLVEISLAANRHAERLGLQGWTIEFATERETKKGSMSLGFTTLLYPPDVDKPVPWDVYSGGESRRLQSAIGFGLGEVLLARAGISPNIEIHDEATKGLSDEGISDFLECLRERSRETGRTIYVVDHQILDRGSFDGTLLCSKNENGSRVMIQ